MDKNPLPCRVWEYHKEPNLETIKWEQGGCLECQILACLVNFFQWGIPPPLSFRIFYAHLMRLNYQSKASPKCVWIYDRNLSNLLEFSIVHKKRRYRVIIRVTKAWHSFGLLGFICLLLKYLNIGDHAFWMFSAGIKSNMVMHRLKL